MSIVFIGKGFYAHRDTYSEKFARIHQGINSFKKNEINFFNILLISAKKNYQQLKLLINTNLMYCITKEDTRTRLWA